MNILEFLYWICPVCIGTKAAVLSNYVPRYSQPASSVPSITINFNLQYPFIDTPKQKVEDHTSPAPQNSFRSLDSLMYDCKSSQKLDSSNTPNYKEFENESKVCNYLEWYQRTFYSHKMRMLAVSKEEPAMSEDSVEDGTTFLDKVSAEICFSPEDCVVKSIRNETLEIVNEEFPESIIKFRIVEGRVPALFTDAVSHMPSLQRLEMDGVGLQVIEARAFRDLPRLTYLSLQHNELFLIDSEFFEGLNRLQDLHLEYNHIVAVSPSSFSSLIRLTSLHLGHNDLQVFDNGWFKNNLDLSEINLDHNKIKKIPSLAFRTLSLGLDVAIDFSNNEIESVGPDLFGVDSRSVIQSLSFRHNNITCLEGDLKTFFMALRVYLDENPFTCECLQKIVDYTTYNKHPGISISENKTCHLHLN